MAQPSKDLIGKHQPLIRKRINWDLATRKKLAKETAITLVKWNLANPFTLTNMMRAFKAVMPTVVSSDERRYIAGPSQAPWLEGHVREELLSISVEDVPSVQVTEVLQFTAEPQTQNQESGIVLDAVSSLESVVLRVVAEQNEVILAQTLLIEDLFTRIDEIEKLIKESFTAKQKPTTTPATSFKRILVVGSFKGQQQRYIEQAAKNYPHVRLIITDIYQPSGEVPLHDHVIVMNWIVKRGTQRLKELLKGEFEVANGIGAAIQLIDKFAQS